MGAVEGRVVEEGLLDTLFVFAILEPEVFDGLGVSFKARGVSFVVLETVLGVVVEATFGVVVEATFGVVVEATFGVVVEAAFGVVGV